VTLLNEIRQSYYPSWPVVSQGKKYALPATKTSKIPQRDYAVAVILPDMQLGYFRSHDNTLEPIHDEQALDVALQIVKASKPDQIVLVGDNLDLCEFGKYRYTPAFARTTQAAIDRASQLCAQLRKLAPDARIVWIAGNHEERLGNFILDGAGAAFGLRRGLRPEEWPVMSVPYLCNLDDYGVEYLPGYPTGAHWINHRLKVIHGDKVASGGSTAHKYLASEKTSVIFGHIHRREWAERTRDDHDGAYTIMAASPGCLARTDGVVPSTKGSTDLDGRPLYRSEDWQTGCGIVTYEPGDGKFVYEQIAIDNGWAFWRGKDYFSTYSNKPKDKD
jgi:predicted phosphodiesterase